MEENFWFSLISFYYTVRGGLSITFLTGDFIGTLITLDRIWLLLEVLELEVLVREG